MLPPASMKLIERTPIHQLEKGFKACVELTVYPDRHTGLAVSEIQGSSSSRRITQRDFLQLNNVDELGAHVLAVIDHVAAAAGVPVEPTRASAAAAPRWSVAELERELTRFEHDLVSADLRRSSIDTYVGRASIFLRWLRGDYKPRGPIN